MRSLPPLLASAALSAGVLGACGSDDNPAPDYSWEAGGPVLGQDAAADAAPSNGWDAGWSWDGSLPWDGSWPEDGSAGEDGSVGLDGSAAEDAGLDASAADGAADAAADDASTGDSGALAEAPGCPGTNLLATSENTAELGPWPVGVRTVKLPLPTAPGQLTVEVLYPAKLGSQQGKARKSYDLREFLKPSQQSKVPADKATSEALLCNCYAELPIDDEHGPYPVVFYIHGTAAMRIASGHTLTHWASRGFIVVAADHPGMYLADMLALAGVLDFCFDSRDPQDVPRDVDLMLKSLGEGAGALAFLKDHIDMTRVGMTGHSQGAGLAAELANRPGVQISIPLSGSRAIASNVQLKGAMYYGGMSNAVLSYDSQKTAYNNSPTPKRLVGVKNAGHLLMTDLCGGKNVDGKDAVQVATEYKVCGIGLAGGLWDCKDSYLSQAKGTEITNYATAAALEEVLQCKDRKSAFSQLTTRYPEVGEFDEKLQ